MTFARTCRRPSCAARRKRDGKLSQFAAGPLLGYDFGPVTVQAYITHDLYEKNYGGHDTRLWTRFIIPIWTPPTTPLYRKG